MTEETIEYRLNAIDEKQEKSDKKLDELKALLEIK